MYIYIYTYGWWFGTFVLFAYIGNFHPSQLTFTPSFFRGVGIPTTKQLPRRSYRMMWSPGAITPFCRFRRILQFGSALKGGEIVVLYLEILCVMQELNRYSQYSHRQYLMKQQNLYSEYIYGKLSSKTILFRIKTTLKHNAELMLSTI